MKETYATKVYVLASRVISIFISAARPLVSGYKVVSPFPSVLKSTRAINNQRTHIK